VSVTVIHADSRDALREMPEASVDACVCDPPYALVSIVKRFGGEGAAPAKDRDGLYKRASAGFMGKQWDTGDTAFDPAFWTEVLRVMKPGAHLIAFGGTRTYHRLVCAIEDAGFEIRDSISWNFGSGFPKSHNVVKRLKESGLACCCAQTTVSAHFVRSENLHDLQRGLDAHDALSSGAQQDMRASVFCQGISGSAKAEKGALDSVRDMRCTSSSSAESAAADAGDVLRLLMPLKDVCRADSAICRQHEGAETGTAIRPEESSVEGWSDAQTAARELQGRALRESTGVGEADGARGRLHHGASASDGADVRLLADADGGGQSHRPQSGEQSSEQSGTLPDERGPQAWGGWPVCGGCCKPVVPEGLGSALKPAMELAVLARKPLIGTIAANVLAHGTGALNIDACRVDAEARETIPSGFDRLNAANAAHGYRPGAYQKGAPPAPDSSLGRWPANVIHDGSEEVLAGFPEPHGAGAEGYDKERGEYDASSYHISGSRMFRIGDTGSAARFFYTAKADAEDRLGSRHPTVKPVDLMAYLIKLVTPPGGTVLDPFAGSGTTGMACMREGFKAILIEREAEYVTDIKRRIAHVRGEDAPLFAELSP